MELKDIPGKTSFYIQKMLTSYERDSGTCFINQRRVPERRIIEEALAYLLEILFPGFSGKRNITSENMVYVVGDLMTKAQRVLIAQMVKAYRHTCIVPECTHSSCEGKAQRAAEALFVSLPDIREVLKKDVEAAFEGDPAAGSPDEIVVCYPGLRALAVHRIAHVLYTHQVPLVPRMMSEIAHAETGIDIHPGAEIGEGFFIDHGTGVVIGETAVIGKHVKLYQGVTLGAVSFPKDSCGRIIRGLQRHPTIGDNVIIYAHATVLGHITVGHSSVVGSNVWLKEDVPPKTMVALEGQNFTFITKKG